MLSMGMGPPGPVLFLGVGALLCRGSSAHMAVLSVVGSP